MDRKDNLPVPRPPAPKNLGPPISDRNTSSSSSSSSPQLLRHVQAALKRHRPLGKMQTALRPSRGVHPQTEVSRSSGLNVGFAADVKKTHDVSLSGSDTSSATDAENSNVVGASQEYASITPSLQSGTITNAFDANINQFNQQHAQSSCATNFEKVSLQEKHYKIDGQGKAATSQGADDQTANGLQNLPSLMNSLTLTDMEWDPSNQDVLTVVGNNKPRNQNHQTGESEITSKSDCGVPSSLASTQGQLHQFRSFLNQPATQCSAVCSGATTTLIHSTSAPMLSATIPLTRSYRENNPHVAPEPSVGHNANPQPIIDHKDMLPSSRPLDKGTSVVLVGQQAITAQSAVSFIDSQVKEYDEPKDLQCPSASHISGANPHDNSVKGSSVAADATDAQSCATLSSNKPPDTSAQPPKMEKQQKVGKGQSGPRKRNYDPDMFFKVNGKYYQRLGKIGSGGSSEVHKVISSDCTIYALKKIKLRGRDYATAYGFCQEIEYLNKLKGKSNMIQLIDYEVTDKTLLQEVLSGSMNNKDGRVKDDGYIYMVLEYGETDLAHMLSQKWKEIDGCNKRLDENWLRFYWQQILLAVNTIHEERIVHSDLKPANFLLVRGALKLIDFGIAKAINSDTTNIQRDSQVGTLSYMSPEAFRCNERDADGNIIKCGRSSDIWSLGCILYQMVYGRTPFAEYKSFWSKFKVITDPNHEITYEPVSNPWLLDLMKKCLVWDRNKRWRIPQLLQHPFLAPPPQASSCSSYRDKINRMLQLIAEASQMDPDCSMLSPHLQQLLAQQSNPMELLTSPGQQHKALSWMTEFCSQLVDHLKYCDRF